MSRGDLHLLASARSKSGTAATVADFAKVRNEATRATVKHSSTVQAESLALRVTRTPCDWEGKLDTSPQFNEREVLTHASKQRADVAEKLALERYESFDAALREVARLAAHAEDMAALEQTEQQLESKGRGKKK